MPDSAYVVWHHRPVMKAVFGFERKVAEVGRARPAPEDLRPDGDAPPTIGCSWCMDFGYFLAHDEGLDESKVREVPRWRESDVFTPVERDVLEYAEAMSVDAARPSTTS